MPHRMHTDDYFQCQYLRDQGAVQRRTRQRFAHQLPPCDIRHSHATPAGVSLRTNLK